MRFVEFYEFLVYVFVWMRWKVNLIIQSESIFIQAILLALKTVNKQSLSMKIFSLNCDWLIAREKGIIWAEKGVWN